MATVTRTKPASQTQSLVTKHCAALGAIDLIGERFFEEFQVETMALEGGDKAQLAPFPAGPSFSLRGSTRRVVENAIAAMEADARNRLAMVQEMKRRLKNGEIPTSAVVGFCIARDGDGERLSEVFSTFEEASKLSSGRDEEGVHAVLRDGTSAPFLGDFHAFMNRWHSS